MRRNIVLTLLILVAPADILAQTVDWNKGGSVGGPRFERGSSSGNSNNGSSRSSRETDTYNTYTPPPNPLPGLVNQYRNVRGWFTPEVFPNAPATIDPSNLPELYRALVTLKDFAEERLSSLRYRKAELERRYRDLKEQIRNNNDLSSTLQGEVSSLEIDIERSNREIREVGEKLAAQNSLIDQVAGITKQVKDEAATTKDSLFKSLDDATRRGLVLSPSNYRTPPEPLEPVYQSGSTIALPPNSAATVTVQRAMAISAPIAVAARPMAVAVPMARAQLRSEVSEQQVQEMLSRISGSMPLINQATEELTEVYHRARDLERSVSVSEATVHQLRERIESLRSVGDTAANALNSAKTKLKDAADAYQRAREKLPVQCLEYAVLKYYKDTVRDFIKKNVPDVEDISSAVDLDVLGRFAKVMSHVVDLGADTLKIIERVPAAVANNVEDPAALQAELDEVVTRFKINLFSDMTGVPKPFVKYFQNRVVP